MARGRPRIHPENTKFTSIGVEASVRDELKNLGTMSETYNDVIKRLIKESKDKNDNI